MNREEWIDLGVKNGWAEQFCYVHDIIPLTDKESEQYYQYNDDMCIPTLRVWL